MPDSPNPTDDGPPHDPAEAELVAYLDGELDPVAARKVAAKLAADPSLRARAAALKKTFDLLDFLPRPEPSPTFTTRTLDKLPAVKSGATAVPTQAVSATPLPVPSTPAVPVPPPPRSRGRLWAAGVLAAGLLALAVGYFGTAAARPYLFPAPKSPDADPIPLADLRVIERLPLYAVADDLDFVTSLADPELFGEDPAVSFDGPAPPPAVDTTDKPTGAELDTLGKAFKSLPPDRQAAIRQLDQQLGEKPPAARDRLFRVLEAYAVWLDRLPDAERKAVLGAGTPGVRLDVVRQVRKAQWVAALPDAHQKQLDGLPADKRAAMIGKWRDDATAARTLWSFARRHWEASRAGRVPWPFDDETRKREVIEFVRNAYKTDDRGRSRLLPGEFDRMKEAHDAGEWLWYGKLVYDASKKYEMLPEPATGKPLADFADLWPTAKNHYLDKPGPRKRIVAAALGKWPDFALAVHEDLALTGRFGPPSSAAYGPCRPADFKEPLKLFVAELEKTCKPTEWLALKGVEGRWPDYPRAVVKLAAARDLSVPGVTLPGPPSMWERVYNPPRPGPKASE